MDKDDSNSNNKYATFAGGCFWCMAGPFQQLNGVLDVKAGYTAGHIENPTYKDVCSGTSGHYEVIQITYDSSKVNYTLLLDTLWRQIDPTDPGGQFYDRGQQYQTIIFYHDEEQKELAFASKKELENSGRFNKPIATKILPACKFYPAEEYHQDYHKKNPEHYNSYRTGSGRQAFIDKTWGDRA
jgi:peptide methionine sulfoxide reductase msrA/msrB